MVTEKRFTLRISENIFNKVKEQAEKNKRSVAKEIEYLLERYFSNKEESDGTK